MLIETTALWALVKQTKHAALSCITFLLCFICHFSQKLKIIKIFIAIRDRNEHFWCKFWIELSESKTSFLCTKCTNTVRLPSTLDSRPTYWWYVWRPVSSTSGPVDSIMLLQLRVFKLNSELVDYKIIFFTAHVKEQVKFSRMKTFLFEKFPKIFSKNFLQKF